MRRLWAAHFENEISAISAPKARMALAMTSPAKKPARVAVVAAGVVSPLGFGLEETLVGACRAARDCVSPVTRFLGRAMPLHDRGAGPGRAPGDEIGPNDRKARRLHRVSRMMIHALREVLAQAPAFRPELTVVGTTSGGMSFGEEYYRALQQRRRARAPDAGAGSPITRRKNRRSTRSRRAASSPPAR